METEKTRVPIRDTKIGTWLRENAPDILQTAGSLLPDQGALGIIKNLIKNKTDINPANQIEGMKLIQEFELEMERENTKRITSFHDVEKTQLQQEDLYTKRARPTRQYFWLLFILLCYPVSYWYSGVTIDLPEIVLGGIFVDFGLYTWKRTEEKIQIKKQAQIN